MNLDLDVRRTFVNYQFPVSQISVEDIENVMKYLNSLHVNNSDISREIVGAKGWILKENKGVLESILAQTFMRTQYGKNCFLDFETSIDASVIKIRKQYCKTFLENTSEEWWLRDVLIYKFEEQGLCFNEESDEFFGFEEMKRRNAQKYSQFVSYLQQKPIRSLYKLDFFSN